MEMFPSFFFDLESPSVEAYKMRQKEVLDTAIRRRSSVVETASKIITRPVQSATSILRPSRNTLIQKSMNKANEMSLQHIYQSKSTRKVAFSAVVIEKNQ